MPGQAGHDNKANGMNRHIYRFIAAVLAAITIVSCNGGGKSEAFRVLEDVDSYIEARPDSALAVLEGINKSELTSKELEAKYALLLSQALDKNYIDLQSDSIIAPAVRYYENHGTPDERLKAFYYRGRISMNANDYDNATEYFIKAEKYATTANDKISIGRLYKALTIIHLYCYDSDGIIKYANKAADFYLEERDTSKYIASLNEVVAGYLNKQDTIGAYKQLEIIRSFYHTLDADLKSQYYGNLLLTQIASDANNLTETIEEYFNEVPYKNKIMWLPVAKAYFLDDKFETALEAIEDYNYYDGRTSEAYLWIAGQIYESVGQNAKAQKCYKDYIEQTDDKLGYLVNADIRFIKERYLNEIKEIKAKNTILSIALVCVVIFLIAAVVVEMVRRKLVQRTQEKNEIELDKQRIEQLYTRALKEKNILAKMIEDSSVKDETKAVIRERLEVLNKVIISHITDTSSANKKAFQELETLVADRESFIESTRLTIEGNNPGFITSLREAGLTDEEINICCLYAIGLKGKDIKTYTNQSRLYIQSAEIRHKLGLTEKDTNLSIHLRNMLENYIC